MTALITPAQFESDHDLPDWRFVLNSIHASFTAPTFPAGGAFVMEIAEAAEAVDHHPDVDLHYPGVVHVALTTHSEGGVTTKDTDLAATISAMAAAAGHTSDPDRHQGIEVAIDATDIDAIRPFWAAVLDYDAADDSTLIDPRGVGAPFWFQQMGEPRTQRGRFHIDVSVPHDIAEQRVAAALAAGGTLVTDEYAKAWWVLADAEGNEACVCTWQDR